MGALLEKEWQVFWTFYGRLFHRFTSIADSARGQHKIFGKVKTDKKRRRGVREIMEHLSQVKAPLAQKHHTD